MGCHFSTHLSKQGKPAIIEDMSSTESSRSTYFFFSKDYLRIREVRQGSLVLIREVKEG